MFKTKLIFVLVAVVLFSLTAFADTVNLNFVGPQGNNSGGEYTYPYEFKINNSTSTVDLMCISFDRTISVGQSWTANIMAIPLDSAQLSIDYRAAAQLLYIADQAFHGLNQQYSSTDAQWAAWEVFDPAVKTNPGYTAGAAALDTLAFQYAVNPVITASGFYNQFKVYVPTDTSSSGPQALLGYSPSPVPEPATLSLFGAGLTVLGVTIRRFRKGSVHN
jgi:hypothetical protein